MRFCSPVPPEWSSASRSRKCAPWASPPPGSWACGWRRRNTWWQSTLPGARGTCSSSPRTDSGSAYRWPNSRSRAGTGRDYGLPRQAWCWRAPAAGATGNKRQEGGAPQDDRPSEKEVGGQETEEVEGEAEAGTPLAREGRLSFDSQVIAERSPPRSRAACFAWAGAGD